MEKQILIADDEPQIRELLTRFVKDGFKNMGIEGTVTTADSAEESLQLATSNAYDLIFHDVSFQYSRRPGSILSGSDFYLQTTPANRQKTVFTTSSGYELTETIRKTMPDAQIAILDKPFRKAQIWDTMIKYLR